MATRRLTKSSVESVEPGAADVYLWDDELPRFGVRVTPTRSRIYLVQYRPKAAPGEKPKTRRVVIGRHGQPWTIDQARAEARTILAKVDLGRDPFSESIADRNKRLAAETAAAEQRRAEEARKLDVYPLVVDRYVATRLATKRSGGETSRLLRADPVAEWRDRHVADIRRSDVVKLLDGIKVRSPSVARATYAALRGFFSWCEELELVSASPCGRVTAPARPQARDRVLSPNELKAVWLGAERLGHPFGPVIELLILTGQRRSEVAEMEWSELDLAARTWRIPKERTKNGKAHEVDLCPEAVTLLESLPRLAAHVFPARKAPKRKAERSDPARAMGVQGFSAAKRALDASAAKVWAELKLGEGEMRPWRIHDLRRTAATGMAALNFPPHVVERVLNHLSGSQSGLVGVYQRHEYREERKAASHAWGAMVAGFVGGPDPTSNIVPIQSARRAGG